MYVSGNFHDVQVLCELPLTYIGGGEHSNDVKQTCKFTAKLSCKINLYYGYHCYLISNWSKKYFYGYRKRYIDKD